MFPLLLACVVNAHATHSSKVACVDALKNAPHQHHSATQFIPRQTPRVAVIRKAGEFIRAKNPLVSEEYYGYPFKELFNFDEEWKKMPDEMRDLFWAVSAIQFSHENFARWVESLEPNLLTESKSTDAALKMSDELFFEVLKKRAAALGWKSITVAETLYNNAWDFMKYIQQFQQPHVDLFAKNHIHRWFSHLIQWVYVAESLERF